MNTERKAEHTKPPPLQVATAVVLCWRKLWGTTPSLATVFLLVAHWALETGWGTMCFCWNLGNAKWAPGYDWCFYSCGEELPLADALEAVAKDPDHALIAHRYQKGDGTWWASCRFQPPHPQCKWKAFASLEEAMLYYLSNLRTRFSRAWPFVLAGDPAGFCHALAQQHYYTAAEHTADHKGYADGFIGTFNGMGNHVGRFDPMAVQEPPHFDPAQMTDADRDRVNGLMALTVKQMVDELGHDGHPDNVSE